MSALVPLLVAAPTVTGFAGYLARDIRSGLIRQSDRIETTPPRNSTHRSMVEYFDLGDLTTTDHRGYVRSVERTHREPWGVYVMSTATHPTMCYRETWLLPALGIRVTLEHARPGHHPTRDYRLDIGEFTEIAPKRWRAVDLYLDVVVRQGRSAELRGVDMLLGAHAAGLVDSAQVRFAFDRATAVVDGVASHQHDFGRWLAAKGITLTWM
ncbi:DUF402 domain-containing protein [Nocardia sp. NPDC050710]|uniref:DUF402 domain-containing protein n=1 Tax=Nocardia sp. NPDC050710 TaxID=3157220 RepID=UPI0033BFD81A